MIAAFGTSTFEYVAMEYCGGGTLGKVRRPARLPGLRGRAPSRLGTATGGSRAPRPASDRHLSSVQVLASFPCSMMDEGQARFYFAELLLGTEALHREGYAHRDIKPANVLVSSDGHLKLVRAQPAATLWSHSRAGCIVTGPLACVG
jgi:serine/threonine protein kinase